MQLLYGQKFDGQNIDECVAIRQNFNFQKFSIAVCIRILSIRLIQFVKILHYMVYFHPTAWADQSAALWYLGYTPGYILDIPQQMQKTILACS